MSTLRAEFREALHDILVAFHAAHPDLLNQVYRARPASFKPPLAYVGPFTEPTIGHEFGNRQNSDIRASLVIVQGVYENAETVAKLDVLADALITFLATQHAAAGGARLLEGTAAEDVDLTIGETAYAATIVTVHLDARVV